MIERAPLVDELNRFSRTLLTDYPSSDALHDLVDAATTILEIHGAGVSVAQDDRLVFVTASPADINALEQVQEELQEGPCMEAFRSGEPVLVSDLSTFGGRWPTLSAAATGTHVRAVASVPLHLDGLCLGALDLYDVSPHVWTDDEVQGAELLAAMATSHLSASSSLDRARLTAQQLQEALDTRVIIEQAKGLLAGERRITMDQAFHLIRAHARSNGAPLRDVAQAIVHLGLRP
jgi:GAF domain-containing protein